MSNQLPGPRELAEYLVGKEKAYGRLRRGDGRCCIGHYCDMIGLDYDPGRARVVAGAEAMTSTTGQPFLPRDHWLFDRNMAGYFQLALTSANDNVDGFELVIHLLNEKADELEGTAT